MGGKGKCGKEVVKEEKTWKMNPKSVIRRKGKEGKAWKKSGDEREKVRIRIGNMKKKIGSEVARECKHENQMGEEKTRKENMERKEKEG